MTTVADCLARAAELADVSDSPRLDAELLLVKVLDRDRTWLYTWPDKPVADGDRREYEILLARRAAGEPVAYILGEREFWSLTLEVNPSTLIPRPDTELLVETTLSLPIPKKRILDLGTGTGAIALALASELPDSWCLGVDCSPEAVQLASSNGDRLGLSNAVFRHSDWFASVTETDFDVILSNPPYIDAADPHLQEGDVRFEPNSALVADNQGLADIEHILSSARRYLRRGGLVMVEHGWQQAPAVQGIFEGYGYQGIESLRDMAGHMRATLGYYDVGQSRG